MFRNWRRASGEKFGVVALSALLGSCSGAPTSGGTEPELCTSGDPNRRSYFIDGDNDGFGTGTALGETCDSFPPLETSFEKGDCNDDDATLWKSQRWYHDADGDGAGNYEDRLEGCFHPPPGYVVDSSDCDDTDPTIQRKSYFDADGDGWGTVETCVPKGSPFVRDGDCDDDDASRNPGAADVAGDDTDADCDGWGFPTEKEQCELLAIDSDEPAKIGEPARESCAPLELTFPDSIRPECASLPDPIIVATRRVVHAFVSTFYDIKIGNTGGVAASIVIRETLKEPFEETGWQSDRPAIRLDPLEVSDWVEIRSWSSGRILVHIELLNEDGSPDCSPVDSTAEFTLYPPRRVP